MRCSLRRSREPLRVRKEGGKELQPRLQSKAIVRRPLGGLQRIGI